MHSSRPHCAAWLIFLDLAFFVVHGDSSQQRLSNADLWQRWAEEMQFEPSKCTPDGPDREAHRKARAELLPEIQKNAGECKRLQQQLLRKFQADNSDNYVGHDLSEETVRQILEGFFPNYEKKDVAAWRWTCLWSIWLSESVKQHTGASGKWLPAMEKAAQEIISEGGVNPRGGTLHPAWPMLIKDGVKTLLTESKQHVWKSREELAKIFHQKIELIGCLRGEKRIARRKVKEWLSNPKLRNMKSNNIRLWQGETEKKDADDVHLVLAKEVSETLLDTKNYSRLVGDIVEELTMNWGPFPAALHTPMHHDDGPQVACQVSGEKTWILLPGEAFGALINPMHLTENGQKLSHVHFDPFNSNQSLAFFPDVRETMPPPLSVRVKEGDCIALPAYWLHATYGHGDSISINSGITKVWKHLRQRHKLMLSLLDKVNLAHEDPKKEEDEDEDDDDKHRREDEDEDDDDKHRREDEDEDEDEDDDEHRREDEDEDEDEDDKKRSKSKRRARDEDDEL